MRKRNLTSVAAVLVVLFSFSFTSAQNNDDAAKLKHFKISAVTTDDSLFYKLQVEMDIKPIMDTYIVIVNITSEDADKQKIMISDVSEKSAIVMKWTDISQELRDGLIAWTKPNKVPVDK
ncbi:MAG: hypothetical protein IAE90_08310 [Ignavibacteria bacterium]|nr:hypothetical protein [Ignavibacteria bacterium]